MALDWLVLCYITQLTKLFHSAVELSFLSHWSCTRNKLEQLATVVKCCYGLGLGYENTQKQPQ